MFLPFWKKKSSVRFVSTKIDVVQSDRRWVQTTRTVDCGQKVYGGCCVRPRYLAENRQSKFVFENRQGQCAKVQRRINVVCQMYVHTVLWKRTLFSNNSVQVQKRAPFYLLYWRTLTILFHLGFFYFFFTFLFFLSFFLSLSLCPSFLLVAKLTAPHLSLIELTAPHLSLTEPYFFLFYVSFVKVPWPCTAATIHFLVAIGRTSRLHPSATRLDDIDFGRNKSHRRFFFSKG